jgi:DNA-binding transcriptional LysR family regulator
MNDREISAFQAVADAGSFTEAAAALRLTQPAISKRIAALEARLGTPLFDRVGRQVTLTAAGTLFQAESRKVVAAMADLERAVANLASAPVGTLTMATSHHIGLHRLAPVLKSLNRDYPDIALDLRFEDSEDAADAVARGEVELAVVTLDPKGYTVLEAQPIWHDPLTIMVARDHPLAGEAPTAPAALLAHNAILPGEKTYTGRLVLELFAAARLDLKPHLTTNYLETIAMLVSAGLGWSMLPQTMLGDRVALPLAASAERMLGIVTNPRRVRSMPARVFETVLRGFADEDLLSP